MATNGNISWVDLARAYADLTKGIDEPDIIYLVNDECPRCGHPWSDATPIKPKCERCNWPES